MQPIRFHSHHGQNISVSEDGTVATRTCSFAHGICFGDRPLNQGEIFLVEILQNERGWSGHLRIGLTQHNPNTEFELPQYALPDFVTMQGKSWVMAVTKTKKYVFRDEDSLDLDHDSDLTPPQSLLGGGEWIRTKCGTIKRSQLLPQCHMSDKELCSSQTDSTDCESSSSSEVAPATNTVLPTEVGSRLGLMYTNRGRFGDLYVIINGEEHGPMAKDIPLFDGPLWPVVDVYGTTKEVRIVHLTISESLQTLCRDKIILSVRTVDNIDPLPLPKKLKMFLKYQT